MRDFFEGIQYLFEEILFMPYNFFRFMESWWASNLINWGLLIIGIVAAIYWTLQLKKFDDNNEEDKSISAHSFL